MKQQAFEQQHTALWQDVQAWLDAAKPDAEFDLPEYYRQLCHHLGLAKQRRYSPQLINQLNALCIACHNQLYAGRKASQFGFWQFVFVGFPLLIRKNSRFVLLASLLFCVPLLFSGLSCFFNDEFVYAIHGEQQVINFESMYGDDKEKVGRDNDYQSDMFMFGFYIKNNIGVSFRTFASGIVWGFGSIFFLVYNGLAIGGVAGYLTQLDLGHNFYPFVVGHGSFELTAIVLSGAAGLKLGMALIAPGQRRRRDALVAEGKEAMQIMLGVILMLVVAAFLEAFWSSNVLLSASLRYAVGIALWVLVLMYFVLAGRARAVK